MALLLYGDRGRDDLARVADFLAVEDPSAAEQTVKLILQALEILESHPLIGRDVGDELRELVISRGATGYVALYEYDSRRDRVVVHAIRHQRESGT